MSADQRPIVVGVDDSAGTEAALQWAAEDARARDVSVRLVCAYRNAVPRVQVPGYVDIPEVELLRPRQVAEQLVTDAVDRVTAVYPRAEAQGDAIDGDPVSVLVGESARATLVVLGSRHLGTLGSTVLGSVSAGVVARAASPAVVVRGPAGRPEDGAGVVIGVDGTEASEIVLEFGFEHASRHRVPVRAVLCWRLDLLAEAWLAETLAGWQEKFPDVTVHREVIRDYAVAGLLTASTGQHLLVVGNRGRHALAGTLLGSVSQGVLHHATCPVAVVPTHGD